MCWYSFSIHGTWSYHQSEGRRSRAGSRHLEFGLRPYWDGDWKGNKLKRGFSFSHIQSFTLVFFQVLVSYFNRKEIKFNVELARRGHFEPCWWQWPPLLLFSNFNFSNFSFDFTKWVFYVSIFRGFISFINVLDHWLQR